MRTALRVSVLVFALLNGVACSSGMRVPADDGTRASFNPDAVTATTTTMEEPDADVRALMLDKVQRYLLKTGQYPKSSVQETELLSLVPTFTSQAPENSTWNYRALVRVNVRDSSTKIDFLIFDRNGEFVVRRVSV